MKDLILYWPRLFREIWQTVKYYKAVKSIQTELEKEKLRIDWIGRIYTVITLKDEFIQQPEMVQQSYVFQQLKPLSDILLKHGLSNEAYPEIRKVSQDSFLVVLYPDNEYLTIIDILKNIVFTGILILIVNLTYKYGISQLFELVKSYFNV
jgi:hypothetical protein